MSRSFSFFVYLNTNKKKQFFQYNFCQPRKLIHEELVKFDHPPKKIHAKSFDFGIRENKSMRKSISAKFNIVKLTEFVSTMFEFSKVFG